MSKYSIQLGVRTSVAPCVRDGYCRASSCVSVVGCTNNVVEDSGGKTAPEAQQKQMVVDVDDVDSVDYAYI